MNETLAQVATQYASSITIAEFTNRILFFVGGLAGATLIYFLVMIYFQYVNYKMLKEIKKKLKVK